MHAPCIIRGYINRHALRFVSISSGLLNMPFLFIMTMTIKLHLYFTQVHVSINTTLHVYLSEIHIVKIKSLK